MLVVGSLLEDGRPVESGSKYRKATEQQQKGSSIKIINEEEFLSLLGAPAAAAPAAATPAAAAAPAAAAPAAAAPRGAGVGAPRLPAAAAAAAAAAAPGAAAATTAATAAAGKTFSLWVEKYRPQTAEEFVGNAAAFSMLLSWLRDWRDVCLRGKP